MFFRRWLATDPENRLTQFDTKEPIIPRANLSEIDQKERNVLIEQLCNKHFLDFDSTHKLKQCSIVIIIVIFTLVFHCPHTISMFQAPLKALKQSRALIKKRMSHDSHRSRFILDILCI